MDPARLERLHKIFVRLFDPNEGTRDAARNAMIEFGRANGVDVLHGLQFAEIGKTDRLHQFKELADAYALFAVERDNWRKRRALLDRMIQQLREENDKLKAARPERRNKRIADLEAENAKLKADAVDPYHLQQIAELEAENTRLKADAVDPDRLHRTIKELNAALAAQQRSTVKYVTELQADLKAATDDTDRLQRRVRELGVENAKLRDDTGHMYLRIKALEAENARIKADVVDTGHAYQLRIRELEAEIENLRPVKDPWHDRIAAVLVANPNQKRWASYKIMDAIGIEHQDVETYRRLGAVMKRIGDPWEATTNIPDPEGLRGGRVRGYQHRRSE
jgi:FtsZ-binding cell division protein ZapB